MENIKNIIKERMKIIIKKRVDFYEEFFNGKIVRINTDDITVELADDEHMSTIKIGDNITFIVSSGVDIYNFEGLIINKPDSKTIIIFYPDSIKEKISRKHFRMDVNLVTLFKKLDDENTKSYKGITMDLSASGVLLLTKVKVEIGTKLNLSFDLSNGISCDSITGEIKRKEIVVEEGKIKKYIYGINFTEILEETTDDIVSYLFQLQNTRRKKGKK